MNQLFSFFISRIFFIIGLISCGFSFSQTIENIEFSPYDSQILISFELLNCPVNEKYDISIVFVEKGTNKRILPKTIRGDLKSQSNGNKRISWEIEKDLETLSGNYYPVLTPKKTSKGLPIDKDGYTYKTVKIGNQEWFAENLRTSKYSDGTSIENIINEEMWSETKSGAWSFYANNSENNDLYGKLYNWYAVNPLTNGNKNICPSGWHVPSMKEWDELIDFLGGRDQAFSKMKTEGTKDWKYSKTLNTNSSYFNALPGGVRLSAGFSYFLECDGYWWSSTDYDFEDGGLFNLTDALFFSIIDCETYGGDQFDYSNSDGMSVRCIKN